LRAFPALILVWPTPPSEDEIDRTVAAVDDDSPTALEPHSDGVRIFFPSAQQRDHAQQVLAESAPEVETTALLVPDENWAERSQAAVTPIRVGRVIVTPPWAVQAQPSPNRQIATSPDSVEIIILPSMGFGTGHHASTRLCLDQLQRVRLEGRSVIDVGTGSGVLAIAAVRLGAAQSLGIDYDPDALVSAEDNVVSNGAADRVRMRAVDLTRDAAIGSHDVLLGNLTGAMLTRHAARLVSEVVPGGVLITSGFQTHERDGVVAAFATAGAMLLSEAQEDTWVAATFRRN
jgi:ribosomal protein L11 methyltransferase